MTTEEIGTSEIVNSIYINGKWKVGVKLNDKFYSMRIEANSDVSDTVLSDLVYKELLNTEIIVEVVNDPIITKENLKGLVPTENKK